MGGDLFVGVDAGTSAVKAAAFNEAGDPVSIVALPNRLRKAGDGAAEQDMTRTWRQVARVLRALGERTPGLARRAAALAVTGQGDGTWLIDGKGRPVGAALTWLDSRAAEIVAELEARGARAAIYRRTGCGLNPCNQSAQLLWLKRREPRRLAAATNAMHCKDWLYFNLTGERATDVSEGVFTFGDFRRRRYAPEILEILDLTAHRRLLPPIIDGCRHWRPLTAAAARACGLTAGLPTILGAVDVVCAAAGGGIFAPGKDACVTIIGSTGMHIRLVADPRRLRLPRAPSGYTMAAPGADAVLRMHSNMSGTLNIDWLAARIEEAAAWGGKKIDRKSALSAIERKTAADCGGAIYHPYIEAGERGPFLNPLARAQFSGIDSSIGLGQIARAVFDGLAFASRHCYEALGATPREVRMVGGGARSAALLRSFADVLGANIRASKQKEASAAGAAMMGAVAVGRFSDLPSAGRAWSKGKFAPSVRPARARRGLYDSLFAAYARAADDAPPAWSALAGARAGLPAKASAKK